MSMQWHNLRFFKPMDGQFVWYVLADKVRHGRYWEKTELWWDCEESCWHASTEVKAWMPRIIPEMPRPEEMM
jgi:hypothetical protein